MLGFFMLNDKLQIASTAHANNFIAMNSQL